MQAAWFEQFGSAGDSLVVGEQPTPAPGKHEVLVRLRTSAVNPSDVKKRAGSFPNLLDDGLVIPHSDGAGIIEDVGTGVSKDRIGERVWVYEGQYGRRLGTAAQFIALDHRRAVVLPNDVDFAVGACLGIPAMTAHRCVFADGAPSDRRVLITGGAGRVGHYAIQWANSAGARVIATASNDADKQACINAGADAVVNHRDKNWSQAVMAHTDGNRIDRVIDLEFGANLAQTLQVIRTGGLITTYGSAQEPEPKLPFLSMMYMDLTIRMVIVYAMPEPAKGSAINAITQALQENTLQHRVAERLPLSEIKRSHELIESGSPRGCVMLEIP